MQTKCAFCSENLWLNKGNYDILCSYKCKRKYFGKQFFFSEEECNALDSFKKLGIKSSCIFAENNESWEAGFNLTKQVIDIYLSIKSVKVRSEMMEVSKKFLWPFKSELSQYNKTLK